MLPRRAATTHTEVLDNELCVYDWQRKEVHALNATAARVWQMCDGRTSVDAMATTLAAELGVDHAEALVWLALDTFTHKQLLDQPTGVRSDRPTISRRSALTQIGMTAAILPVVTSIVAPSALAAQSLQSQTFGYTNTVVQTFVVPAGVTSINIDAYGGDGGASTGKGGRVQATVPAVPGESLSVRVGGLGGAGATPLGGAFGGGQGGTFGGGGGGYSDLRRGTTRLVVAGGGGGYGVGAGAGPGGHGGTLIGSNGTTASAAGSGSGGGGGTQAGPGAGGAGGTDGVAGSSGSAENGGQGGSDSLGGGNGGGGGGGGGYFGGGGGGGCNVLLTGRSAGGGGGGSSYTDPGATNVTHTSGANIFIDGRIVISW